MIVLGLAAEITLIATMIIFQVPAAITVATFSAINITKVYLLKKHFSLPRLTQFNYYVRIQDQETEIRALKKQVEFLLTGKHEHPNI